MSGPGVKVTRIARGPGSNDYWDESRHAWVRDKGTRYKTIAQAVAAMKRWTLDGAHVVTHG